LNTFAATSSGGRRLWHGVSKARKDALMAFEPGNADWETLLSTIASLYVSGVQVDWRAFDRDYARQLVALPTYPFERKRYWIDPSEMRSCPGPLQKVEV